VLKVTSLTAGLTGLIGLLGLSCLSAEKDICGLFLPRAAGTGGDLCMMSMVAMVILRVVVVTAGELKTFEYSVAYMELRRDDRVNAGEVDVAA